MQRSKTSHAISVLFFIFNNQALCNFSIKLWDVLFWCTVISCWPFMHVLKEVVVILCGGKCRFVFSRLWHKVFFSLRVRAWPCTHTICVWTATNYKLTRLNTFPEVDGWDSVKSQPFENSLTIKAISWQFPQDVLEVVGLAGSWFCLA